MSGLREKLLRVALASDEFYEALKLSSKEIRYEAKTAQNEATIEGAFERVLYATLREIGVSFHPEKESMVETIRHTGKGRADSRIGAVVIEYKHRSKLSSQNDIKKAIRQLEDYLLAISKNATCEMTGFLTDGLSLYEIRVENAIVFFRSGKSNVDETSLLNLIKVMILLEQRALTAKNLIEDFCGEANQGIVFNLAKKLYKILSYNSTFKTKMLQSEWEEIFRLAHEDTSQQKRIQDRREVLTRIFNEKLSNAQSEYQALFALHTAYAIVLKLMAFRVVSDLKFGSTLTDYRSLIDADSEALRSFCSYLEDGEIFRAIGILNLLEGDFFLWYSDRNQWNDELAKGIRDVLEILAKYEGVAEIFSRTGAVDLFRELYEATVPQVVRSSFGEIYTPYWLAQHVLRSSILKDNWRMLDPCGGSGTFVIAAISQLKVEEKNKPKEAILEQILNRITAIDLNPLSVLTTRINYFINISDLLPEMISNLVIPVYLGDSSYVPEKINVFGIECLRYKLNTLKKPISVELPVALVEDTPKFVNLMYNYEHLIKNADEEAASKLLIDSLGFEQHRADIEDKIMDLTRQLVNLEKNKWNGIWARILTNFLITGCLGRFSNIVGNPPWIDWKNLPAGYREKVKSICIERKLFSGAGRTGGINLNICALITHVSITNWLDKHGRLAFLMPRELACQASYEGWRQSVGGKERALLAFHDWSKAGHPFDPVKEDFLTYVIGDSKLLEERPFNAIQNTQYIKKAGKRAKSHEWRDVLEAMKNLKVIPSIAGQIIPGSTIYTFAIDEQKLHNFSKVAGDCAYIGREGIEFFPQELQLFTYEEPGRPKAGEVFLRNVQKEKSKYKIPSQKVLLETRFLYPMVKGPEIEKFRHNYSGLITLFPYERNTPNKPLDSISLAKKSPLLLSYYKKYRSVIEKQTEFSDRIRGGDAGEFYGLARTGPYSFQDIYVAFRDNSKWRATVISSTETPWGENKRFVFQNHAASMCERKDGSGYIEVDEAHYICAIMNAPIVEEFIYASSDGRSFKIRPPIYIPKFDKNNEYHRKLSNLSKEAHESSDIYISLKQINDIYLELCENRYNS